MWDTIIWSKKKLTCIPQDNNLYQVLREDYTVCYILVLLPSPHPRKGWFRVKNQIKDNKGALFTWANSSLGWRDPSHLKRADRLLSSLWSDCWQGFSPVSWACWVLSSCLPLPFSFHPFSTPNVLVPSLRQQWFLEHMHSFLQLMLVIKLGWTLLLNLGHSNNSPD